MCVKIMDRKRRANLGVQKAVDKFKKSIFTDPISLQPVGKSRGVKLNKTWYARNTMKQWLTHSDTVPHSRRKLTMPETMGIIAAANTMRDLEGLARDIAKVLRSTDAAAALRVVLAKYPHQINDDPGFTTTYKLFAGHFVGIVYAHYGKHDLMGTIEIKHRPSRYVTLKSNNAKVRVNPSTYPQFPKVFEDAIVRGVERNGIAQKSQSKTIWRRRR